MSGPGDWSPAVAAAHATGAKFWLEGGVAIHRVTGGGNNALYRVEVDGQRYAWKLCVADERRRAAREYGALRLLDEAGVDVAPQPLWLDESCTVLPFPTVVYRWLSGEPLGASPKARELAALLESYRQMHALRQTDHRSFALPTAWFHWFDFAPYLDELQDFLAQYGTWLATTQPDGRASGVRLRNRLARQVDRCVRALTASKVEHTFPRRLCRVDPNLLNSIWCKDGLLRWVDWEYSGWGDPALDLAELRWHAALAGLSEAQHAWLRDNYQRPADDPGFDERLAAWDCLLATRWPFLVLRWLWSEHHGPDRLRLTQLTMDEAEMWDRFVRFIERADCAFRHSESNE